MPTRTLAQDLHQQRRHLIIKVLYLHCMYKLRIMLQELINNYQHNAFFSFFTFGTIYVEGTHQYWVAATGPASTFVLSNPMHPPKTQTVSSNHH